MITGLSGAFGFRFVGPPGLDGVRAAKDGYRAQCLALPDKTPDCVEPGTAGDRVACRIVHLVLEKK